MDSCIPQHFLHPILFHFSLSGAIKMPVEVQMEKPPLGNQTSTRFIGALANARILELILAPILD